MSVTAHIETDPPLEGLPDPFPQTDSQRFVGSMFDPDRVAHLGRATGVNTDVLGYAATHLGLEEAREVWGDHQAEAAVAEAKRRSELAWHPPAAFIRCLDGLAKRVGSGARAGWLAERCNFDREYFASGLFLSDLQGCLAAIRWAEQQGAKRARFFVY